MKPLKPILLASAAALLGLVGLASCGNNGPEESSSSAIAVTRINNEMGNLPVAVGEEVNLDDYITVVYNDGTESKDFTVTATSEAVTVSGHTVSASAIGTYTLDVEAGERRIRVTLDVRGEDTIALIDYLMPLTENANNFSLTLYDGNLAYDSTVFHNPTYGGTYNEDNPGATYSDGSATSFFVAQLQDGYYYMGEFNKQGVPVFSPGRVTNYAYYYVMMSSALNPLDFNGVVDDNGDETIIGSASASEAIFYAASLPLDAILGNVFIGYGECEVIIEQGHYLFVPTWQQFATDSTGTQIVGDTNGDGVMDEGETWEVADYYYAIFEYTAIGNTHVTALEAAQVDASYIPEVIRATELEAGFDALNPTTGYTINIEGFAVDASGNPIEGESGTDAFTAVFGGNFYQTTYVTSDGIYSERGSISIEEDGSLTHDAARATAGYFNREGQGYAFETGYEGATDTSPGTPYSDCVAINGVTNVYSYAPALAGTAAAVDGFDELNITARGESDGWISFASEVGDNTGTRVTNTLFRTLFDQLITMTMSDGTGVGTAFTQSEEFSNNEYHALTVSSDYNHLSVNPTTGEIDIAVELYIPYGFSNNNAVLTYSISNIGSTTADFSDFTPSAA